MKSLIEFGRVSEATKGTLLSTVQADGFGVKILVNGVKCRTQPDLSPLPPQYPQTATADKN